MALYTGIYGVCRSAAAIVFYALIVSRPERQFCPFPTRLTQRSGGSQWTPNPLADLRLGMLPDTLVHCNLYNGGRYNLRHSFCLCPRRRSWRNRDGDALRNLYVPASSSLVSTSCIQLTTTQSGVLEGTVYRMSATFLSWRSD